MLRRAAWFLLGLAVVGWLLRRRQVRVPAGTSNSTTWTWTSVDPGNGADGSVTVAWPDSWRLGG